MSLLLQFWEKNPTFSLPRRLSGIGTFRDVYLKLHHTYMHLHKSANKIHLPRAQFTQPIFCPLTWTKTIFYWDFSLLNLLLYHSLEKHLKISLFWKFCLSIYWIWIMHVNCILHHFTWNWAFTQVITFIIKFLLVPWYQISNVIFCISFLKQRLLMMTHTYMRSLNTIINLIW